MFQLFKTGFICSLIFGLFLRATEAQTKYDVQNYSTANGLSDNRIRAILKDRDGFLWFGTWAGINRFDGRSFVTYKSYPGDRSPLKSNRIDEMVEDRAGFIWLKTYDREVFRFDRRTGQFLALSDTLDILKNHSSVFDKIISTPAGDTWLLSVGSGLFQVARSKIEGAAGVWFSRRSAPARRLPSDTVLFVYPDRRNDLWVGTSGGLAFFKRQTDGNFNRHALPGLGRTRVTSVAEDGERRWLSTADGRLIGFDGSHGQPLVIRVADAGLNQVYYSPTHALLYCTTTDGRLVELTRTGRVIRSVAVRGVPLSSIYEDRSGVLWIEPLTTGIVRFDPASGSPVHLAKANGQVLFNGNFRVVEDNRGVIWANIKGGGLCYYDDAAARFRVLSDPKSQNPHRLEEGVSAFYVDATGILWFGTEEAGIGKVVFPATDFQQSLLIPNSNDKRENEVRGLCRDHFGRLWVGSKAGSVLVVTKGRRARPIFTDEPAGGFKGLYAILEDSRGRVWLGTKENGLFRADPLTADGTRYRLTHFVANPADRNSLSSNMVYSLLEDKQQRIWVGTFEAGPNLVDESGPKTRFINWNNGFTNYPGRTFNRIRSMATDARGNVWIGTTSGLVIAAGRSGKPSLFSFMVATKRPGDIRSLGGNDVQHIYRDEAGDMWVSTSSGGINRALGNDPFRSLSFVNYSTKNGLPSDYVLNCRSDAAGDLWIATQNGLSTFDKKSGRFRNFDTADGLPENRFSEGSPQPLADGSLVFGLTRGYLQFNPTHLRDRRIPGRIAFTGLLVNSEQVTPAPGSLLVADINNTAAITLDYDQDVLSIDYSMLDYRSAGKVAYRYRLAGFDRDWRNNYDQTRATYTNVPPGDYTFQVKSLNSDLYLNTPYRELKITILPPPWKTWWAYLAYTIVGVIVTIAIRRTALTLLKLRHRIAVERQLAELKMSFFAQVSHELRTPLTLILNPIEEIAANERLSPAGVGYAELVRKSAARMMRFVNQLLDLGKLESGKAVLKVSELDIARFVSQVSEHFDVAASKKNIGLSIRSEGVIDRLWADAEKLDVVLYNVLANALKFTPEGKKIRLTIRATDDNSTEIEIADQGPGVSEQDLEKIFELYYQEEKHRKSLKGTGIGLALAREIMELHHGRIFAKNNADGGLSVFIRLQCGRTHLPADVQFVPASVEKELSDVGLDELLLESEDTTSTENSGNAPLLLLVEDNRDLSGFLAGQLNGFYRVEVADDGHSGLQKAIELLPDLVLTDVMMPGIDGIQLLDRLKNDIATSHIPVIVLSAKHSVESQIEGLKYGADYYITKPFNIGFLVATIGNLLKQRRKLFEAMLLGKPQAGQTLKPADGAVITSHDEAFLNKIIRIVEEKMSDPQFNIDTVADSAHMSRSAFYKKFKSLTNLAPVEFVREMRLKRARQLMDEGEHNISIVAYSVGFSNAKYFSTCFRQEYGKTPSEYLREGRKIGV